MLPYTRGLNSGRGRDRLNVLASSFFLCFVWCFVWRFGRGGLFERQRGLQVGCRAAAFHAIRIEAARNLSAPFRFYGQVALRGSGNSTLSSRPSGLNQGRVTKTTNFSGFAIYGAAMLAGFYHRSVLRCGRLAERKSGVARILAVESRCGKKWLKLS